MEVSELTSTPEATCSLMPKLCVPPGEKHCSYERMGVRLASKFETVPCSELILTV